MVILDNLKGEEPISDEHVKNNCDIRNLLKEKNIYPENLPPAKDVKKINRKIQSENNKLITTKYRTK